MRVGVVELRQYALHPGARETLIELFERELIEPQEAVGIRVLGTFRDEDDPDSFVWLRGFADMAERKRALHAFYDGPVWAQHRDAANATMVDSDNVLLLRPLEGRFGLALGPPRREPRAAASVTICPLDPPRTDAFARRFEREIEPALRGAGANVRATFVSHHSENTYPALPVREDEHVFVWLALFADERARDEHSARVDVRALVGGDVVGPVETLRLQPTSRSPLPDDFSRSDELAR